MSKDLSILLVEDVPTDAELVQDELQQAGLRFVSRRVETRDAYLEALAESTPDIILSDYLLPTFDGLSALKIAREKYPEIPFIFVTGALGEERVIELVREGATDYILKNRLTRLASAVSRALHEAGERAEKKRMEQALKESEVRYRTIFENTGTATIIVAQDKRIVLANRQFELLSGFSKTEIEGKKSWTDFLPERSLLEEENGDRRAGDHYQKPLDGYEIRMVNRNGEIRYVLINVATLPPMDRVVIALLDITEFRKMEREKREASLYARSLIEASLDPLITISAEGRITDVNRATETITGFSRERLIGSNFPDYFTKPDKAQEAYRAVFSKGLVRDYPLAFRHISGRVTEAQYNASLFRDEAGQIKGVFAALRDVTERVEAEKKLLASNEQLRSLTWELIMTEERERRRIAVDLHDNIGQTMALTKMKLETLREQSAGCDGLTGPLADIGEMLSLSIQQARSLMRDLSPSVLYELGFAEAIVWLGEQFQTQYGLQVTLYNDGKVKRMDQEVQLLLFRSIRELLMNIVKHAGVQQASIVLQKAGRNIKVTVRDEGTGFDAAAVGKNTKQSDRFGLLSIRERVRYIGGLFEIESKKGHGASIHLMVPQKSRKKK
jgi:PAS domain S-box-containing protein